MSTEVFRSIDRPTINIECHVSLWRNDTSIQPSIHPSILCGISFTNSVNSRCNQTKLYVHSAVFSVIALRMVFTQDVWMYATKLPQTKQDVSIKFVIGLYFLRLHACAMKDQLVVSLFLSMTQYRIKHCTMHIYIVLHRCILIIYETYWHAMIYEYVAVCHIVPDAFTMQNAIMHPTPLYGGVGRSSQRKSILNNK